MNRILLLVPTITLVTLVSACGDDPAVPDIAAFRQVGQEISDAVQRHRAASQTLEADNCAAEQSRYQAEIVPMLDRMEERAAGMNACMEGMGHSSKNDMEATCASMVDEMELHMRNACSTSSIAGEADRHGTVMTDMIDHEMRRASDMDGMMGTHMMGGRCST